MISMTGYGKGTAESEGKKITVELKSVNHRFLDLSVKIPKTMNFAEETARKILQQSFSRGHIDVYLTYENNGASDYDLFVNEGLADEYVRTAAYLADKYGIENDFTVSSLMKTTDVITPSEKEQSEQAVAALIKDALEVAVEKLQEMRAKEGFALKNDLIEKADSVGVLLELVKQRAPEVVKNYRAKIEERITEALAGVDIDEARLINEVAFFADKACIDEETARLTAHIDNFYAILESDEPVGRKLDFLVQEMNREVNTIGSKSNDIVITNYVVNMKSEIEKIREQVQNVE